MLTPAVCKAAREQPARGNAIPNGIAVADDRGKDALCVETLHSLRPPDSRNVRLTISPSYSQHHAISQQVPSM